MKLTPTNAYVLRTVYRERDVVRHAEAPSMPHLRRCLALGLVERTAEGWALTATGRAVRDDKAQG